MQELNLNLLAEIGGWPALKEARALVERGKVSDAQRDGATIRARVQGAEKTYEPRIVLAERVADIEVKCTCIEFKRTGRVCAHALAAGVALLNPNLVVRATSLPGFASRDSGTRTGSDAPPSKTNLPEPEIEARLDGALSGLTLELAAHYGEKSFPIQSVAAVYDRRRESNADAVGGHRPPLQRNFSAEQNAITEAEAAGFARVRAGATILSMMKEPNVARFLANVLPRWRREWKITLGARLESVLTQVDVAQPEFSLRGGSGEEWLSLDLKLSAGGKPIPLDATEIQRWLQTGQSHTRLPNKRVLLVPTEAWQEMQDVLADCDVEQEPGAVRVRKTFAPYLSGALVAQGFSAKENVAADFVAPDVKAVLDEKLWTQLRPYQAHGVEWLAGLAQRNFSGLLADDMGLGKTVQALAFAAWLRRGSDGITKFTELDGGIDLSEAQLRGEQGRSQVQLGNEGTEGAAARRAAATVKAILIVCPTSLVTNWLREAARFVPHLRALDLTGADRAEKFARRGEFDLLVTSYAILRRDFEMYRTESYGLVVLDEAQHIKNRGSQNAQAAKALQSRRRLVLTGTPLENSVLDLWSIFDFLLPGYLGTATEFRERYETPLAKGAPDKKVMARLRQRVKPFFLRRTKSEVLTELPPKLEFPALVELSDEQKEVYRAVLAQGRREVFEHSDKEGRKSGRDRLAVLTTLLRLRQVCCHLDLLPRGNDGITKFSELTELVEGAKGTAAQRAAATGEPSELILRQAQDDGRWREPSAKMERTFELIDEAIDGGHRVLLFSQFVRVLHLLRDEAARRELRFCYLDGQTVERQAEVDRFQNDAGIPIFFISLKAGGTGLNLTGADTVIHFDPWWNPAVEEQATSRAHRMGQSRSVQAYKLIAAGTVEEKIQALQARKRELFEASLASDEAFVEKLSGEDLEELLGD